jgi:hypothetical protein
MMPRRPPETWWRGGVSRVESHGRAVDPRRVCGAVWSRKSTAEKRASTIMAERKRRKGSKKGRARARTGGVARKRPRVNRARTSGAPKRRTVPRATPRRPAGKMAAAGALPLLADTSQAGRRRLRLAERLGIKVR